ncbi:MAG TPA: hypothetical protein DDZ40_03905, partial [Deltaproteobacteria bacterium]|nr:hypothetical protein [Deltaproteobacteria bacterium]
MEKKRKKDLLILGVLRNSSVPLTSIKIARELESLGHDISERTVRLYLQRLNAEGLAAQNGKKGHEITLKGESELDSSKIIERVGFLSAKIDRMTYQMSFDLNTTSGSLVINVTLVDPRQFAKNVEYIRRVYADGYAMGHLLTFLGPGESLGHITIP